MQTGGIANRFDSPGTILYVVSLVETTQAPRRGQVMQLSGAQQGPREAGVETCYWIWLVFICLSLTTKTSSHLSVCSNSS